MSSNRDTKSLTCSYFNRPLRNPMLPITIPDLIDKAAVEKGSAEAYSFKYQMRNAETCTYGELRRESEQLASAFIELGLVKGDRVALAGDNCLDWIMCEMAVLKAGLVVVRVNQLIDPDLDILVQHFQVRMLIFYPGDNNEYFHKLQTSYPVYFKEKPGTLENEKPKCLEHVIMMIRGRTQGCRTLGHLLHENTFHQRKVIARQAEVGPDDIAVILITSGSSNALKCVGHSHFTLVNLLTTSFSQLNTAKEDKVLVATPMSSRSMDYYLPLISQVSIVAIRGYKMSGEIGIKFALRVIEREKINALCFGPQMMEEFVCLLRDTDQKDMFIHWGRVVGALTQEIFKLALNYIPGLMVVYGMVEHLAIAQTCMHDFTDKKLEYTGVPTPGTEVKVVGSTRPVANINEVGEIVVRSVYNCRPVDHYNPDSRLACVPLAEVDENGWLHTGDVGFMTNDGHIRIMGVRSDVIERGNTNYYAKVIQEVLFKHPYIEEAAIIGVPDKLFSQKICAFVRVSKNSKAAGETKSDKLKTYCEQRGTLVDYFVYDNQESSIDMEDKAKLLQIAIERLELNT